MNNDMENLANPEGSLWHRWDPHIHMPGTLKNDNFKGENVIEEYVKRLNEATPTIRAVGITDYYVLDSYEKLLALKNDGKLPHVELLFPNIELRFPVNAGKGSPINVHLLVCPDDPDHINNTKRFLSNLKFEYDGEQYGCTNDELTRLGYAFNPNAENDAHAQKLGVEQSKITPENLRKAFKNSAWAKNNIMIALAASKSDGTAQLQDDGGLRALREELQRSCHIIFSSRPGDRAYWCGKGTDSIEFLKKTYGGPKPCLHGCDAHELGKVGAPDEERYCWIRGDLTFETLRQICFEPEHRVYIGKDPLSGARPSDTIKGINVKKADWMKTAELPINPGLVAIIGARGSGKTALVELIAAGAKSVDSRHTKRSFLERAKDHLHGTTSDLTWGNGESTSSPVHIDNFSSESDDPRVRYLSQQFVDQLCSSDGLADDLVSEIERVIFEAHAPEGRLGARNFEELRKFKTRAVQRRMSKCYEALREIGDELSLQDDLRRNLEEMKRKRAIELAAIERMKNDRKSLTPTDNKGLLEWLDEVRTAAEQKSHVIAGLEKQELNLSELEEEIKQFGESEASMQLSQLKTRYSEAGLTDEQWKAFELSYEGDVEALLNAQLKSVRASIANHKGPAKNEAAENANKSKAQAYFDDKVDMKSLTHFLLLKEQRRLEECIGVDDERRRKYNELSGKIVRAEAALVQRDKEIKEAEEAPEKIKELLKQREAAYCSLVSQIEKEGEVLTALYKPLQDRLENQKGTLNKLTFSVRRKVDIDAWAEAGERLIDKSRAGFFKGIGTLTQIIKDELEEIWKNGNAENIADAMSTFRAKHQKHFWDHAFDDARRSREARKAWFDQVSTWLYSTDHVQVTYGLEYESVDIQQLSPGTRGIVLLLLYLSIDIDDERPLIIDQPEENLDPESVYHELVACFKEAKARRQIIIVTHNANLVVNTDADQVIVASRGEHKPKALPDISYISGGLENSKIREAVCSILEGGQEAFKERARRLRILLN
jgi:energy-coupling factor transporter ATP-binding protein EcfA2